MSLAKLAGDPWRPIGVTVHWYLVPLSGTVKLVVGLLLLSSACCQNPVVRLIVVNVFDSARPISSMRNSELSIVDWVLIG